MEEGKPLLLAYRRESPSGVWRRVVLGVVLVGILVLGVSEGYTHTVIYMRSNVMNKPAEMQGFRERAFVDWCDKVGRLFR